MEHCTYYFLILCLLNITIGEKVSNTSNKLYTVSNYTKISNQYKYNLKGSVNDLSMDDIEIESDSHGFSWYASGYIVVYNAQRYIAVACGFSEGEPSYTEILEFLATSLVGSYSTVKVEIGMGSRKDSDDRFSCFIFD